MSATFKNAKKMVKQEQLRKIMKDYKKGLKEVKKIESQFHTYNELGQLTCILCKTIVKSEAVWVVHINAKQHKENIELAKKLKEKTNNFTTPLKRPLTPPLPDIPEKKIKGILKNALTKPTTINSQQSKVTEDTAIQSLSTIKLNVPLGAIRQNSKNIPPSENPEEPGSSNSLPEGFFDDPIMDAKARNQEYKDPLEVEWDKFLKEMKVIENESEAIIAEDQDEATNERHIEEIEEQMILFNKVLDLEKKKDVAIEALNQKKSELKEDDEELDEDIDEFLDWRQKKTF
ncbi:zinc finger protein 830 [Euwallacea fornicatus]|uniref:zinc finger protein 830 n=1 Tax=Euwallacea fornicatus TaxID=995702 RepID=UPI00338EABF6